MFGKGTLRSLGSGVLLLGLSVYVIGVYWEGTIALYIHPRYSLFAVIMAGIAAVALLGGIVVEAQSRHRQHVHASGSFLGRLVNGVVALVVLLALLLPARPLSPEAIARRMPQAPQTVVNDAQKEAARAGRACPSSPLPHTIGGWVFTLSDFPAHCYKGAAVELTGFFAHPNEGVLPKDIFYIARAAVMCCAVDTQPYVLPLKGLKQPPRAGQWVTIRGHFVEQLIQDKEVLVVEVTDAREILPPANPYEYL